MAASRNEDDDDAKGGDSQRLDKWLWVVRVIKSRTQAAGLVSEGKVRVNTQRVTKPSHTLKTGDVVTVSVRGHVRVLKMLAPGMRRGPPAQAQTLYEEVSHLPPAGSATRASGPMETPAAHAQSTKSPAIRDPGQGRPTKRDRRQLDRLRDPEP